MIYHLWEFLILLVILVGPIPLCWFLVQRNVKEVHYFSIAHTFLLILTAWSLIQIIVELSLGVLDQLKFSIILGCEIFIFLGGLFLIFQEKHETYWRDQISFSTARKLPKLGWIIVGVISFVGIILLERLATNPITDYDSLWFHLPIITRWYQTGSLTFLDPAGHWLVSHQDSKIYPYHWHLLSLLFLYPFQEDVLVAFPMLISWVVFGLSVYLISRKLGATRYYSLAGAALVLMPPYLLNQVNTIHIDLPLASFYLVGLYFAISYHRDRSKVELALFFSTLGLLAGIKIPGLIYGAILLGLLGILEARHLWNLAVAGRLKLKSFLKAETVIGISLLVILGSFWYLKNFPYFYEKIASLQEIKVASLQLNGLVPINAIENFLKTTLLHQFNPLSFSHWKTLMTQILVRLQIPFIVMTLQIALFIQAFLKNRNKLNIQQGALVKLLLFLFLSGLIYWCTPYSSGTDGTVAGQLSPLLGYNIRYAFPFLGILGIATAVGATVVKTSEVFICVSILLSGILGVISSSLFDAFRSISFTGDQVVWLSEVLDQFSFSYTELATFFSGFSKIKILDILIYVVFYVTLIFGLIVIFYNKPYKNKVKKQIKAIKFWRYYQQVLALTLSIVIIINSLEVARDIRDKNRQEIYQGIYQYIEKNLAPDEKIGYFLSTRSYLFYGKHFKRQVFYIPLNLNQLPQWLNTLKQQTDVVAAGPLMQEQPEIIETVLNLSQETGPLVPVFGQDVQQEPVLYRMINQQEEPQKPVK